MKMHQVEGDEVWNSFSKGLEKSKIRFFMAVALYICDYPPLSYFTKGFAVTAYLLLLFFNIVSLMTFIFAQGDPFRMSETLFYSVLVIHGTIGYFTIHRKRHVIERMFSIINDEFYVYDSEDTTEHEIIRKTQQNLFIEVQKYFHILTFVTFFMWSLGAPIYDIYFGNASEKTNPHLMYDLPVPMWVPFKSRERHIYLMCYFSQLIAGYVVVFTHIVYNMTIIGFTSQIICQLKILCHSIRQLEERANYMYIAQHKRGQVTIPNSVVCHVDLLHTLLKRNILHYNTIEMFVKLLLEYTKSLAAFILFAIVIVACNGLFLLTLTHQFDGNTLKLGLFLIAFIANFLFFCACGTLITMNSEDILESIYFSAWYKFPRSVKKNLRIFQIRTFRFMEFQAGIYPLNLSTFIELLRATYSAFNVLNRTNSDK